MCSRQARVEQGVRTAIAYWCEALPPAHLTLTVTALLEDQASSVREVLQDYLADDLPSTSEDFAEMCCDIEKALSRPTVIAGEDASEEGAGAAEEGAGRCQMCERNMPLTKHHVIPKSTHNSVPVNLFSNLLTRLGFSSLSLASRRLRKKPHKTWPEGMPLDATVDICRPCHSAIHRTHDELTLARDFWSIDLLLQDAAINKFVSWVSRQRVTTRSDAINPNLHYRR
ncbi:unnamed protein product [Chrysoparadoxa australica]